MSSARPRSSSSGSNGVAAAAAAAAVMSNGSLHERSCVFKGAQVLVCAVDCRRELRRRHSQRLLADDDSISNGDSHDGRKTGPQLPKLGTSKQGDAYVRELRKLVGRLVRTSPLGPMQTPQMVATTIKNFGLLESAPSMSRSDVANAIRQHRMLEVDLADSDKRSFSAGRRRGSGGVGRPLSLGKAVASVDLGSLDRELFGEAGVVAASSNSPSPKKRKTIE